MITELSAVTVKQLNLYVKSLLEGDSHLQTVTVTGELSSFKNHYASGHYYFTLKDKDAAVPCVMFRSYASQVDFEPRDGDAVVLIGRVSLYERDGKYQLYAERMFPVGAGALALKFERIKEKLSAEGLFDRSAKRPIPAFPREIAVVTSETGAAVRDILSILERRYPAARVLLCPVAVQGALAVPQMLDALKRLSALKTSDVIIIGRGGGSAEELWEFNSEELARAVAASPIPVISAVGHETDFSICDFAADLRAPTPSAAAELATPDFTELKAYFEKQCRVLKTALSARYERAAARLERVTASVCFKNPVSVITAPRDERTDIATDRLLSACRGVIAGNEKRLAEAAARLDALSPLKTISRGYAAVYREGRAVRSVGELCENDGLTLRLADGTADCIVKEKRFE